MLGLSQANAADCHVDHYQFVFQSDTSTSMVTRSGGNCFSRINGSSSIDAINIGQQPAHGSAFVDGTHRWGYRSTKGYVGPDMFVVTLSGTSFHKGRSGTVPLQGRTNISVNVNVVP